MSNFVIETDVPFVPGKRNSNEFTSTLEQMGVNSSIKFKDVDEYDRLGRVAYTFGRKVNKKFAGNKNMLRLWRTE